MARNIRYFNCPDRDCKTVTGFDLNLIVKPESNFLTCDKCKRKFYATLIPSCCNISLLFVNSNGITNRRLTSIQSFKK